MIFTHAFAEPNDPWLIDFINPDTQRSVINGHDLAQVRERHPNAAVVSIVEWRKSRAAEHDAIPREWKEVTETDYLNALGALPPAAMRGAAFLLGEPHDHHPLSGRPTFSCFRQVGGRYEQLSVHITEPEFRQLFGPPAGADLGMSSFEPA